MAGKTSMRSGIGTGTFPKAVPGGNAETDNVATSSVASVDPFAPAAAASALAAVPEVRPGFKLAKAREVKPHVSVYLHPRVIARMKELAAVHGCKAHDLYLEALDAYLRREAGTSLDDLSRD